MNKRSFWMLQGALLAIMLLFGLSLIMGTLFGSPSKGLNDSVTPIWCFILLMTIFNTFCLVRVNYKEPT